MVVKSGGQEVTIRLKPDQLGRMSLVARSGAEGLVARITTESTEVRQFLENNLPALQQALETQGLKVHHIDVLMQERFELQSFGNMWQQRPGDAEAGQGSARRDDLPIATGAAASVVEELPLDAWTLAALHPHSTFHTIA
jgi:flagellar hook-length control protein FliK